jgi:hypothetical protein
MRFLISALIAFALFLSPAPALAQWRFDIEAGIAWNGYNDVQIPGTTGTFFSLSEELKADPAPVIRLRTFYSWTERSSLSFLAAPLRIHSRGLLNRPILFGAAVFPANTQLTSRFQFDSYRLTYAYIFHKSEAIVLAIGGTAKIRSASIRVESSGQSSEKPDLGFVPLVNFHFLWRMDRNVSLLFEGDALAAPQGRAEDVLLALQYAASPGMHIRLGYRLLEGGADASSVYTFTWVNYVTAGMTLEL